MTFLDLSQVKRGRSRPRRSGYRPWSRALKGSSDPNHFISEINVGKGQIRHRTTLNFNLQSISGRSRNSSFKFRVVVCRIRPFPTLISKTKWLGSELPLNGQKMTTKGHLRSNDSYKTLSFAESDFVDCFNSEFEFVSND